MDNTKRPAYPLPIAINVNGEISDTTDYGKGNGGFTKLELASLMIAQGMLSNPIYHSHTSEQIAKKSVAYANAVLEEANK